MRIAIMSDFHLGFGDKERTAESHANAKSAINLAIENKADLIILAGDIFDEAIPSQECLFQALKLFSIARKSNAETTAKIVSGKRKDSIFHFKGIPIAAIFGTHEYRGQEQANVLDILQEAGSLLKLHGESAVFEKEGEKICIYGMGGVPEKKALDVLQVMNPQPLPDSFNIFFMHQSIKEFLPFEDDMVATIALSDFPKGFDLIVNGHLHWHKIDKINDSIFIMPGSTITTQMKKIESEAGKGIFLLDTKTKNAEFLQLPNQRKFFYKTIMLKDSMPEDAKELVKKEISGILVSEFKLKPLIKIKIKGALAKGISSSDLDFSPIEDEFSEKAFVSISKDFEVSEFKKKIAELRNEQQKKQSIKELAMSIFEKNLNESHFNNEFDYEKMLALLSEDKNEEALEMLAK